QEKVMLVVTGEMGRTPRINKNGGREHWGELTSLLISGGGIANGQVIGQSDAQANRPVSTPYTPEHLFGTVLKTFFDTTALRLQSQFPEELIRVVEQAPTIHNLFG
ncbi:MAG: DUF1501 domain-containing protein, partial [Pseudomonadales bacterium]|nr:DUF1501 domain-containing protein [Pseudomonadales bacterium]